MREKGRCRESLFFNQTLEPWKTLIGMSGPLSDISRRGAAVGQKCEGDWRLVRSIRAAQHDLVALEYTPIESKTVSGIIFYLLSGDMVRMDDKGLHAVEWEMSRGGTLLLDNEETREDQACQARGWLLAGGCSVLEYIEVRVTPRRGAGLERRQREPRIHNCAPLGISKSAARAFLEENSYYSGHLCVVV
jgi:hypothetical protein